MTKPLVRVYVASSLDGFMAGPNDDLSWLPDIDPNTHTPPSDSGALEYDEFIASIGALLMGRSTYDFVRGAGVDWPYGDRPVLVATNHALDADPPDTVRAVHGSITELIDMAKAAAGGKDVYLDGGTLIGQAAAADLIDDLTITLAPGALGRGSPLFGGLDEWYPLEIVSYHPYWAGMLQVRARPLRIKRNSQ